VATVPSAKAGGIRRRGSLPYSAPAEVDVSVEVEGGTQSLESSTAALENEDFLSSWEKKVLEGLATGEESAGEEEHEMKKGESGNSKPLREELAQEGRGAAVLASAKPTPGSTNGADQDQDQGYSSDSTVISTESSDSAGLDDEDATDDYLRGEPTQAYTAGGLGGQVLFFDQSRFDADADFFSAETENSKSSPSTHKGKAKAERKKREAGGSPRRVRWSPTLISDVQYRDRVGYAEKGELFFTHNEEYQFTLDQNKEMERAEALGKVPP
jgi:hypothetical protein